MGILLGKLTHVEIVSTSWTRIIQDISISVKSNQSSSISDKVYRRRKCRIWCLPIRCNIITHKSMLSAYSSSTIIPVFQCSCSSSCCPWYSEYIIGIDTSTNIIGKCGLWNSGICLWTIFPFMHQLSIWSIWNTWTNITRSIKCSTWRSICHKIIRTEFGRCKSWRDKHPTTTICDHITVY